jgi:5,10-methylene-tetrahydrofolate dehydrogenase/methenyl tetrahydrofolate cyclohydrolase
MKKQVKFVTAMNNKEGKFIGVVSAKNIFEYKNSNLTKIETKQYQMLVEKTYKELLQKIKAFNKEAKPYGIFIQVGGKV